MYHTYKPYTYGRGFLAFVLGMLRFRRFGIWFFDRSLQTAFNRGRRLMHRITFRLFEHDSINPYDDDNYPAG